ncbi:MAG: noncanonical pyrimidine nucleotidase, YjjG family [Bacteroidales bacterium]|nr:noncanonical pyrimidine nucleotidase, YjjG family [Bacteroidales bacterium]
MKVYKHLFFDLDSTLWDFEKNAHEAFTDIYIKFDLKGKGVISLDEFVRSYLKHNDELWALYRDGKIEKEYLRWRRFEVTLNDFGIHDPVLAKHIGNDYVTISPKKTNLFPNAIACLEYLKARYELHIITNGFEEVQYTKLENSNLRRYFRHVITSEAAGSKKPDPRIFNYALKTVGALPHESLMIGDDIETDIKGASNAGLDAVFFNPEKQPHNGGVTHEIFDLLELTHFL